MNQLKNDPGSRRIIVSAWNLGELDKMALAPAPCVLPVDVADTANSLASFISAPVTFSRPAV
ncbi:thymidylate synthase [Escherichia coli]